MGGGIVNSSSTVPPPLCGEEISFWSLGSQYHLDPYMHDQGAIQAVVGGCGCHNKSVEEWRRCYNEMRPDWYTTPDQFSYPRDLSEEYRPFVTHLHSIRVSNHGYLNSYQIHDIHRYMEHFGGDAKYDDPE